MAELPKTDGWIAESTLAFSLKVDRSVLRAERPYLRAGEVAEKNGAVVWQPEAAQRIAAKLGLTMAEATPPAEEADAIEELMVQSQAVNRNIVNALRSTGERVALRVVDNRKYLPRLRTGGPMVVRAKKSTAGNWWLLVGREPRWPGMW